MAGTKAAKSTEPKATRKMLTPAERIAKLEADLVTAREAAAAKATKKSVVLKENKAKLVAKRDEINGKISDIDAELDSYGLGDSADAELPIVEDEAPSGDES